jgi:hypothetical protein
MASRSRFRVSKGLTARTALMAMSSNRRPTAQTVT